MKRTKNILLTIALLLSSLAVSAHDFEVGGIYYNITSSTDLTVEVTFRGNSYDSYDYEYSGSITIPATVTYDGVDYSVTSIGSKAFYECRLTSITIPESVTSIGVTAFFNCTWLTSITIPESVTSIGEVAFANCSGLTAVHVSSIESWCNIDFVNSYSNPLYYAKNLYLNGELVTELTIPASVTSIGSYAFRDCSRLTSITIPENSQLTSIGKWAFAYCSSLTSITIPESVTSIGGGAFAYCSSLTSITCKAKTPPTISDSHIFYNVDKSIPVYVYTGSVEAYQSAEYWNEFTNIIGIENLKCATPTISYQDGQFALTCDTEGAEVITHAAIEGEDTFHGLEFEFIPTLTFTAYATKKDYENSDEATVTLCWIPCTENHGGGVTEVITIPAKPVLIQTDGGTITVNGLAEGTVVKVNDLNGVEQGTAIAADGTATITTGLTTGSVAIVQMGEYSVKVAIK